MLEDKIEKLIAEGNNYTFSNNSIRKDHGTYGFPSSDFQAWAGEIEDFIITNYGNSSSPRKIFSRFNIDSIEGNYEDKFEKGKTILISALQACSRVPFRRTGEKIINKDHELNNLFNKFHLVVKQLRNRYNSRSTLDVEDEYDVQDLLHSLLRIYFNDIRSEEWTPSYAGGSSRMDFLLKEEGIVIEVKKTRKGLNDKELGKQLIEDKEKYKSHPDCKKLICFSYDPDGRIANPKGIENDLNGQSDNLEVLVVIKP